MFDAQLPADRGERWKLLDRFIEAWFAPWQGNAGVREADLASAEQRLGVALPIAFREWYLRYAARADVWSRQDTLRMPPALEGERGVFVFCREAQNVVQWGIRVDDLAIEDPPVVVSDRDGTASWFVGGASTSAFALQFAVLNAKWSNARCRANGSGTDEAFAKIESRYPRLPFSDMHWPAWPTRFYGTNDIIIEAEGNTWIWTTARSKTALAELDALLREAGMEWEHYEG